MSNVQTSESPVPHPHWTLRHSVPAIVIVPGLNDSGPAHWQTDWQLRHPEYRRVAQRDWSRPDLHEWSGTLARVIHTCEEPVLLVAHSFGCLVAATAAAALPDRVAGLLLVAPADPERFVSTSLLPHREFAVPSTLVGSRNDPWMALSKTRALAQCWGSRFIDLGNAGHINADSGFGPWPDGEQLLERLRAETGPT